MTTARTIIGDALTFRLNRLSPGETLDADTASTCLSALNSLADELNGGKSFLFREIFSTGTVTGASGTLGTTWSGLSAGDEILSASYADGSLDEPLTMMTMAQYHALIDKTTTGDPWHYIHDGSATVYFWPVPTSVVVKLRTKQVVSEFADLDTDYTMPKGYRAALADLLAEKVAPALIGSVTPDILMAARKARHQLSSQTANPAILGFATRPSIFVG